MDWRDYINQYSGDPLIGFSRTNTDEGLMYDPVLKYNTQITTVGTEYDTRVNYIPKTGQGVNYTDEFLYERSISDAGKDYDPGIAYNRELKDQGEFYQKTFTSFSGSDMVALISIPGLGDPVVLGELQTLSYSIHRPKVQVRTLGRINPKGFTKSGRTIAGSLVFTVFNKHIVHQLMDGNFGPRNRILMDEIPPFNITVSFSNEYGQRSALHIYGVEIIGEGQTMSIEDMITENVMNYIASDIDIMNENTYAGYVK